MTSAESRISGAAAEESRSRPASFWTDALAAIESSRALQFAALLVIAFAVRITIFGDWTYHTDEQFYSLVGQRMLQGKLLYVDMWDRKGPVLFLIYAACALISKSVLSYQIAATISAALGAFLITRLAARLTEVRYALLAGVSYYGLLAHFGGGGGQSPVFYNTLMLVAAYTIATNLDRLRSGKVPPAVYLGIICAGLAMAVKAVAAIEGAYFGIVILALLWRSPCSRSRVFTQVLALAVLALAPYLITFLYFAAIGHFGEVWNALVMSNLNRTYDTPVMRLWRSAVLLGSLVLILVFAAVGWYRASREKGRSPLLTFLAIWAVVALGAVLFFPNIYVHYALPIAPPLCILSARYFARGTIGLVGFAILLVYNFTVGGQFDFRERHQAYRNGADLAAYVRAETPDRKLLVYSSANYLYALVDAPLLSRIAFATHLFDDTESGVTGLNEHREVRQILATRPQTVVFEGTIDYRITQNMINNDAVRRYLKTCRKMRSFTLYTFEEPRQEQRVYSLCRGR